MSISKKHAKFLEIILEQLVLICRIPHVDKDERLGNLGLDSIKVAGLMAILCDLLGEKLEPTLFWSCATPAELARQIAGQGEKTETPQLPTPGNDSVPVVITGLACRFPGAGDSNTYWRLLIEGKSAISKLPRRHFSEYPGSFWHVSPEEVAGFLEQVSGFDYEKFGIGAHEAANMDPQQRLLVELSWAALEQAGMEPNALRDQRGGVYVGAMWSDFSHHVPPDQMTAQSATGLDTSILSARLSFILGLNGPSMTVNTACSSSLVALHLACQAIRQNECDFALVAGVNLLLAAQSFTAMRRFGGLSETNICHTFDAAADGYVRAEGAGVLILKPLSTALRAADPIWGVIRSSAVNNNGFHGSLTAPSVQAQERLLRQALQKAGINPGNIQYVEAHGTGTAMGDPIEITAISRAYCQDCLRSFPLRVGSAKTNIGHTEAAAGMAGLIKVLLAMKHGVIPAHLNYQKANPSIDWDTLNIQPVISAEPWDVEDRIAGISSFGFGGTNAHVIISQYWPCETAKSLEKEQCKNKILIQAARTSVSDSRPLFIFPGQGAHWQGMGLHYARLHPVFRTIIKRCDYFVKQLAGWSLSQHLYDEQEQFFDVRIAWPCHFAMQLAITEIWKAKGVRPASVIGHSIGEVAAAHVAGLVTLKDALHVILRQAEWIHEHSGFMGLLNLDFTAAEILLSTLESTARCAIQHGSESTVITGSLEDFEKIKHCCADNGIVLRLINTTVKVHAEENRQDCQRLLEALGDLPEACAQLPFYSGVGGGVLMNRLPLSYWADSINQPLKWFNALQQVLHNSAGPVFEIASHPVLGGSICEALQVLGISRDVCISGRRGWVDGKAMSKAADHCLAGKKDPEISALLLLSGHSKDALRRRCASIAQWLSGDLAPSLKDCALALISSAEKARYRLALVADSTEQAIGRLRYAEKDIETIACDSQCLNDVTLRITDYAPLTEDQRNSLLSFPGFSIVYSQVILAGADRDVRSPLLEAAAQQMGCIALLSEAGVTFDHYDACQSAQPIVELIEERCTLCAFIDRISQGSSGGSDALPESMAKGAVSLVVPPADGQICAPDSLFHELLARCHCSGATVTSNLDLPKPLLALPAVANSPVDHDRRNVPEIYSIAWKPDTQQPFMETEVAPSLLMIGARHHLSQLQAHAFFSRARYFCREAAIATELDADGSSVMALSEELKHLLQKNSFDTVVYIWGNSDPLADTDSSLHTALLLLQYLHVLTGKRPVLHIVTAGAQAVCDAPVQNPSASMAWGLIRTALLEMTGVTCSLVDLEPSLADGKLSGTAIADLAKSLRVKMTQSAWRFGKLFLPVLIKEQRDSSSRTRIRPGNSGFHLITGGMGAFGLELLRKSFSDGERRFLLLGRQQPHKAACELIDEMCKAGAKILTATADVTCHKSVSDAVRQAAEKFGPLTDITHAAGILQQGNLAVIPWNEFEQGLSAKYQGAVNLHFISQQWPIRRFTLVSSVSSFLGFPQYAAYATGNAFLDGLASYRKGLGLPAVSVCFGPFQDKGMLENQNPLMQFRHLGKICMEEGARGLDACPDSSAVLAIMSYSGPPEFAENISATRAVAHSPGILSAADRHAQLCETVKHLAARLLQCGVEQIPLDKPLSDLGVTSLLGVEIRNRLQTELQVSIPATVLWNYPTATSLARYLEGLVWPDTSDLNENSDLDSGGGGDVCDDEKVLMAQLLEELATIKNVCSGEGY